MRPFIALVLLIAAISAGAENTNKGKRLSESDYGLITRCSQAAFIVVWAVDTEPDELKRLRLVLDMQKVLATSQKLGKATPTEAETISAFGAVGTLLMQGASKDTAQGHDTLVGQATATCALETKTSQ